MVNARSGPMTYKSQVGDVVLSKHVDDMKPANSQAVQEQNIHGPLEQLERLSEPVGSHPLSSVKETLESEMVDVAASTPLPPEEKDEFLPRCSGRKRWAMVCYILSVSEVGGTGPDERMPQETLQEKEQTYVARLR
eukprot:g33848.t1